MPVKEMLNKLRNSKPFKKFYSENPSAYFCAAFLVYDYDCQQDTSQLDFWSKGRVMTFFMGKDIVMKDEEFLDKEPMKEIKPEEIKFEIEEAIAKSKEELDKHKMKPSKIIAVLQRLKESNKLVWNITAISGFNLLRLHISMDGRFLLNKRASLLDMMKLEKGLKNKGSNDEKSADYIG